MIVNGASATRMSRVRLPADREVRVSPDLVSSIYFEHYTSLCRTARLLVDDPGRAEELVQDAFTRTLAARAAPGDAPTALAYLRRAVVHACHSELRRRRVERRIGVGPRAEPIDLAGGVAGAGPESGIAERAVDRDQVTQLLRSLPPRQREAVVLRYYADLDEAAIAVAMRCTVGAVKSQLFKARRQLSELLQKDGEAR